MLTETYYIITIKNRQFYYKESIFEINNKKNITASLGGDTTYCVVVAIYEDNPTVAYIDIVEYDSRCAKDILLEHKDGTFDLVTTALWTIHTRFPSIKVFTLKDDSHILCEEGSKKYKLNLACESILKYGKTWYQYRFNATLSDSLLSTFYDSQHILDKPLDDINFQASRGASYLLPYKSIYTNSKSPRDFFKNLREKYQKRYCHEVYQWIKKYMDLLNIKLYSDSWFITTETLNPPQNYTIIKTAKNIRGGMKKRKTRRANLYTVRNTTDNVGSIVGIYENF